MFPQNNTDCSDCLSARVCLLPLKTNTMFACSTLQSCKCYLLFQNAANLGTAITVSMPAAIVPWMNHVTPPGGSVTMDASPVGPDRNATKVSTWAC